MDKLAQHYAANAFVDEFEKLAGYALSEAEREYLYKEAMLNLGQVAMKGKQLMQAGAAMAKNPAAAAQQLTQKAQMAAMNVQANPVYQQMAMNPSAAIAMGGGSLAGVGANLATNVAGRAGLGAIGNAVPALKNTTSMLSTGLDALV